jgi:hypothetical protein
VLPAATHREEEAAHRGRDLRRLLAVWRQLSVRYIAAQAHHGLPDEIELIDALVAVEDALRARHRRAWRRLQGRLQRILLEAEHRDQGTSVGDCITCRRFAGGLPVSVADLVEEASR